MPTLEELQEQLLHLQEQLAALTSAPKPSDIPPIEIRHIVADPGYVFVRNHDGMVFGNEIYLGYDYSLGFRRVDQPEYYTQVPDPNYQQPVEEEWMK